MKCGIFYGSTTGNTGSVAELIKKELDSDFECKVYDVGSLEDGKEMEDCDLLIFGASTWGDGDLQDDWSDFIGKASGANLGEKTAAIFGLGDQESYSDCFVNGMREMYDFAKECGADIIGAWSTEEYSFDESLALAEEGRFLGLVIDEDNQSNMTKGRVATWCNEIKKAFSERV